MTGIFAVNHNNMDSIKGFFGRFFNQKNDHQLKNDAWISTSTGRRFHIFRPTEEEIVLEEAVHALCMLCRFNGHTSEFYSVAQHSIYVSMMCSEENALCGLMHDIPEAYIGDMATPLKRQMYAYNKVESKIWDIVSTKFRLPKKMPTEIKEADKKAFRMEWAYLMGGENIENEKFLIPREEFNKKTPAEVKEEFTKLFYKLVERHNKMVPHTV